jgi:hypothetical protein
MKKPVSLKRDKSLLEKQNQKTACLVKKILAEPLKAPVHLRVTPTRQRAEKWLAQRNTLGKVLYELIHQMRPGEAETASLLDDLERMQDSLGDAIEQLKADVEKNRQTLDLAFGIVKEILGYRYGDDLLYGRRIDT